MKTLFLVILGVALLLRLLFLGMKQPHFDEGVNGYFVDKMRTTGAYEYDPSNYHGPLHFYVLFLMQTLFGREIIAFRLPLVAVNLATLWLIFQFRRFIPWRVCAWAGAAFAVSAGMVFYSRYAIHEAWQVFALLLTIWGAAELWTRGSKAGLWAIILGPALAILTKETYVLHFASFGLAYVTLKAFERWVSPSAPGWEKPVRQQWRRADLLAALSVAALSILFFYSGGFQNFSLLPGLITTFNIWSDTGVGGFHGKPWHYWWKLLGWYEIPTIIGILAAITALLPGMNRLLRFMAIWGLGVFVAYSIIFYKTPWCIISIIWPFFFLLGEAIERYRQKLWGKVLMGVAVLALLHSLFVSTRLNFLRFNDGREPYVYVQITNDLDKLTGPLKWRLKEIPTTLHRDIHILMKTYHPLPWVLGDFTRVYYAAEPTITPDDVDAMVVIADAERIDYVEARLRDAYFVEPFRIFNESSPGRLYLHAETFAGYFPDREPERAAAESSPEIP